MTTINDAPRLAGEDDFPLGEDPREQDEARLEEEDQDFQPWRAVLIIANPMFRFGDTPPDFETIPRYEAKHLMRKLVKALMWRQDQTFQSQDPELIAFADACVDVATAIYRVAFDEPPYDDVEPDPTFVVNPETGDILNVQTFADAEKVRRPATADNPAAAPEQQLQPPVYPEDDAATPDLTPRSRTQT